ncbi:DUF362 domain-containing protein [Candidatus Poribacteria bacterium]|jgi:uncharacterized protein (DUF362 family)|nr:DUF362 domain-containing protein [Candidatus Poribacteria bacterium]MBT5536778.1 DUF362 domain-containing protein [Candidatus Poribacteria bacterium]MBT7100035.1 DUF362 domain-containing protein [Candidatus Poribacteria bacterium]MBT7807057.1 DUF362 domain-containing protein [Candidatus Poribacteria bacterium]
MERREFIKRVGGAAAAVVGAGAGALLLHNRPVLDGPKHATLPSYAIELGTGDPRMSVVTGTDVPRMVAAGFDGMGGIAKFVQRDDVVLVKANVAFDRPPMLAATTRPEVLHAVVMQCREAGARKVIVADNPINQPASSFFKSGIKQAAEEAGAEIVYPYPSEFEELYIGGETLTTTWPMFYGPFKRATKVIGVAPLKDHNLCHASMTMKNWYGLLGGGRNRFHQDIHGIISDFPHMMKPTLVVLDGTRILTRNGPTGGSLSDVAEGNTLVMGVDMVAVDAYGYDLLRRIRGSGPDTLDYLEQAHARGLGNRDWRSLNVKEARV